MSAPIGPSQPLLSVDSPGCSAGLSPQLARRSLHSPPASTSPPPSPAPMATPAALPRAAVANPSALPTTTLPHAAVASLGALPTTALPRATSASPDAALAALTPAQPCAASSLALAPSPPTTAWVPPARDIRFVYTKRAPQVPPGFTPPPAPTLAPPHLEHLWSTSIV